MLIEIMLNIQTEWAVKHAEGDFMQSKKLGLAITWGHYMDVCDSCLFLGIDH